MGRRESTQSGQNSATRGYNINVLERTFKVLEAFSRDEDDPGITELIKTLKIPKSTVHRIVMILEAHGYLERSRLTGRIHLGSKLIHLGMRALSKLDLGETATPILNRLAEETGETAHLGVLRDGEIISLFHAHGRHVLRAPSTVGRRVPVHCTSLGKAILAHLPEEEAEPLINKLVLKPYTKTTLKDRTSFKANLKRIREVGYSLDNEEFEEGLKCLGAPIHNHLGNVIAALSVAMPSSRLKKDRIPEVARFVKKAALDVSLALGFLEGVESGESVKASKS